MVVAKSLQHNPPDQSGQFRSGRGGVGVGVWVGRWVGGRGGVGGVRRYGGWKGGWVCV